MQSNDSLVLCLHCWCGFAWQLIWGVNSSSSIDRCDNDDSGNAQITITTVAMMWFILLCLMCGSQSVRLDGCQPTRWECLLIFLNKFTTMHSIVVLLTLSIWVLQTSHCKNTKMPCFHCSIQSKFKILLLPYQSFGNFSPHITTVHSAINEYTARDSGGNVDE